MLDIDDEEMDEDTNHEEQQRKKLKQSHLYKAPTADELNSLRETENLFHSNLFRMQVRQTLNPHTTK